jgi:hypothetical protein
VSRAVGHSQSQIILGPIEKFGIENFFEYFIWFADSPTKTRYLKNKTEMSLALRRIYSSIIPRGPNYLVPGEYIFSRINFNFTSSGFSTYNSASGEV